MAKSHWVVETAALKRQPGVQRPFLGAFPAPDGVELTTAEVQAGELNVDLDLEMAGDELVAQGLITIAWTGPCRRCLEPQHASIDVELREIFQKVPVEGETYRLDDDQVDLEPMVREVVLLNLPVAPLCRDDCAGPDPERFPTSVAADPVDQADQTDEAPPIDPRWAALSQVTFDSDA